MASLHIGTLAILLIIACTDGTNIVRRKSVSIKPNGMVGKRSAVRKHDFKVRKKAQQPAQKWIYAIQTCARETYVRQLETQLSTWLKPVDKNHVLIVGGPHNNGDKRFACDEGPRGQNCKEASVLYRGAGLAEEVDADWLFHVIDDAYVFLPRVWKAMEGFDPSKPVVFANFGCGALWKNHKESNGGKNPKPEHWVEPEATCERVEREGGMCTGAGYIVSRGALKLLRRSYTLPSFIEHYTNSSKGRASDLTSSCLFYNRNIAIQEWPPGVRMAQTGATSTVESIVAEYNYGSVHVNFGKDKARIPSFMQELQKAAEQGAL